MAKPTASTPKAKRLQKIWVVETKKDALAIADHRGEILKFIGDGLLAIFPLAAFEGIADAAMNAMAAAHEALAAVHAIEHESLGSEGSWRRLIEQRESFEEFLTEFAHS